MLQITELHIYPIKSLGGIAVAEAKVETRGLQYDRRWMLVDENNRFLTQREHPRMALLQTAIVENGILVFLKTDPADGIEIPFDAPGGDPIKVTIWDDVCSALYVSSEADQWFTRQIGFSCRLVYMPEDSIRKVDLDYAANEEITGFSDAYPVLVIGQASLDDLNSRLEMPVSMDRFRPNIVFGGGYAFEEDEDFTFHIGDIHFRGVKPCARCVMTTVNQQTGEKGKEPLKTLAAYRTVGKKVLFGQNLLHEGSGTIRVGDELIRH
ncbi:MOSC domain-containing protein [Flavihumibacter petaseus]|uniref:MOSC domain-containing protein n=1 Tax=Flavihumibacter petaseus NBRC 106054 TaxID=1220578 RepID=A0A0E9N4R0_9BACT|nr:MOSC N-terminal beta barrel domain-containing protein [Flavihumibacter petaseus]GAO44819.1 hypothetical protein FPE01S_04_00620 [Flavihumibacter petaseus NBRC 106054]